MSISKCDSCGTETRILMPIRDMHERVTPGAPMPSGECPTCGGLCYQMDSIDQGPVEDQPYRKRAEVKRVTIEKDGDQIIITVE